MQQILMQLFTQSQSLECRPRLVSQMANDKRSHQNFIRVWSQRCLLIFIQTHHQGASPFSGSDETRLLMKLYVFQHAPTGERALIKLRNYPLPPCLPPSLSPLRIYNNLGPVQDQMTRAGNPLSASQHKVSRETERPRAALIFTISQVYNSSRNRQRRQRQQQLRRGSQDIKRPLSVFCLLSSCLVGATKCNRLPASDTSRLGLHSPCPMCSNCLTLRCMKTLCSKLAID